MTLTGFSSRRSMEKKRIKMRAVDLDIVYLIERHLMSYTYTHTYMIHTHTQQMLH